MLKRLISATALVVLVHGMAGTADAFTYDKRTYFTFNQSVALPGVTLPAGTYMFRLADPDTTRRVIQVSDRMGTHHYAMLLTMPADREDASRDSEVRFLETPADAPRALSAWWYVGDRTGYEFIYSKQQLAELNRVPQPVPVAANEPVANNGEPIAVPPLEDPVTSPDVIDGAGVPPEESADVDLEARAQQPAEPPPFENQPPPAAATSREELPQTASPLGIILLTGLAAGGLGLRLLRKS
jgi:hypothetical protein